MDTLEEINSIPHYSSLLLKELKKRCLKNKRYSLRSFARDLELSPSFLSRLLRKEISISVLKSQNLMKQLHWSVKEKKIFLLLVQFWNAPEGLIRESFLTQLKIHNLSSPHFYFNLSVEHEIILNQWYHLAIVELTQLNNFVSTPAWISSRLGITAAEAQDSIQRLLLLGLLYYHGDKLVKSHSRYWIGNFQSSQIRNFHRQHLKIAEKVLEVQSMAERLFIGSTFPLALNQLDEVKKIIQEFHRQVLELSEESKYKGDQVYHLGVQLYRLDKLTDPKN